MKKLILFVIVIAITFTTATTALGAQTENTTPSGIYVTKSGVLVDGDKRINCRTSDRFVSEYKDTQPTDPSTKSDLKDAISTLRYCKANGYPAAVSSKNTDLISSSKSSLPETGGGSFTLLAAGTLLVASGLLYRGLRR